jgi:hypothetical protein
MFKLLSHIRLESKGIPQRWETPRRDDDKVHPRADKLGLRAATSQTGARKPKIFKTNIDTLSPT